MIELTDSERLRLLEKLPVLALVGRRNAGKSTLFNYLTGRSRAITRDEPGVTVDTFKEVVTRTLIPFSIMDMPGLDISEHDESELNRQSRQLALSALKKCRAVLYMLEYPKLEQADYELLQLMRQSGLPLIGALNKVDNPSNDIDWNLYYETGLKDIIPISARGRRNIEGLLEQIISTLYPNHQAGAVKVLGEKTAAVWQGYCDRRDGIAVESPADEAAVDEQTTARVHSSSGDEVDYSEDYSDEYEFEPGSGDETDDEAGIPFTAEGTAGDDFDPDAEADAGVDDDPDRPLKLAIVGRPNCGKSSILNRLLGYERAVVSGISGTTRDSTDTLFHFNWQGQRRAVILIDTAGIRRQAHSKAQGTEYYSMKRSERAIRQADVILHVIDAAEGMRVSKGDKQIQGWIEEAGKPSLLVLNKWDLVETGPDTLARYTDHLQASFARSTTMEIITVSAKSGKRVPKLLESASALYLRAGQRIATPELNRLIKRWIKKLPGADRELPLRYAVQVSVYPVKIKLFISGGDVKDSTLRFVENRLREHMKWQSVPVKLELTSSRDK